MNSERNNDVGLDKVPFEVALDRAGFGVYSYLLTALTGLSIISMACVAYATTILAPTSACELDTTSAQQGLIVAAPIIGLIIGAVIWGRLADLKGRRKILLVSMLCSAIMNAVSSLSINWIMLMVLQLLAAVCASGQYSIAMSLLSESVPMAQRNLVVLAVSSIFMLSQGIMSLIAMPIIPLEFSYYISWLDIYWNPWRTLLLVYSAPSLICFVWVYFMQESPKYAYSKGEEERALQILKVIYKMNHRNAVEEFQVKGLLKEKMEEKKEGMSQIFKRPLLKYLIIMTILAVFLKISAFMAWLPTIMNHFVQMFRTGEGRELSLCAIVRSSMENPVENDLQPCGLDETSLLLVFAVSCVQSIFNICISLVVNKVGRRNMVIAISAMSGVSGVLVNFVSNAVGSGILFLVFLMGMVLLGLHSTISIALFPTSLRAVAMAMTSTASRIAMVAIVQVINLLLVTNCELAFYIFASMVASSAIVASFLPDDRLLKKPDAGEPKSLEESRPEMRQKEKPLDDKLESTDIIGRREIETQRL